jgi:cytochrome P450
MQSFFHHVLSSPAVHATLRAELDEAIAAGRVPATGHVEWSQAQALPYFQACLREAMRLRPAVGVNITRYVPPGGAELAGRFFRGGTRVAVNGWVLHRDRDVFGADADAFRPERWLGDEHKAREMDRFMFQVCEAFLFFGFGWVVSFGSFVFLCLFYPPGIWGDCANGIVQFGGGAHVCIGRNLALLEINKVIPRLLRDFNFELVYPNRELKAHASFFVVQEGLEVYIEKKAALE